MEGGGIRDEVLFRSAIYCLVTDQAGDPVNKPPIYDPARLLCRNRAHPVQIQIRGQGGYRPIITIVSTSFTSLFPLPTFIDNFG